MAAVERCDLSDLPVDQCGCRKHPKGKTYDARQVRIDVNPGTVGYGQPIAARYAGVCPECGERFAAGDTIRAHEYGGDRGPSRMPFTRWIHADCAE